MVHQDELEIATHGRGLVDVTAKIAALVARSGVNAGTCTVFVRHTSASLAIQENADPAVLRDPRARIVRPLGARRRRAG